MPTDSQRRDSLFLEREELKQQLARVTKERDAALSSDFAMVWNEYACVPDAELTADAIALKNRLITAVRGSGFIRAMETERDSLRAANAKLRGLLQEAMQNARFKAEFRYRVRTALAEAPAAEEPQTGGKP